MLIAGLTTLKAWVWVLINLCAKGLDSYIEQNERIAWAGIADFDRNGRYYDSKSALRGFISWYLILGSAVWIPLWATLRKLLSDSVLSSRPGFESTGRRAIMIQPIPLMIASRREHCIRKSENYAFELLVVLLLAELTHDRELLGLIPSTFKLFSRILNI